MMDRKVQDLIVLALIGLVAGYLAHVVLGGGSGLLRYLISGLIGAIVGPFLLGLAKIDLKIGNPLVTQIAVATIGAIAVVLLAKLIS